MSKTYPGNEKYILAAFCKHSCRFLGGLLSSDDSKRFCTTAALNSDEGRSLLVNPILQGSITFESHRGAERSCS